ncbi:MAG: glycosyltransferase family 39 protein [Verrucomicrobiota bacterium]
MASALRVVLCVVYNPMANVSSDMARHWNHGARFFDATFMSAIDPPLYQLYLSALRWLSSDHPLTIGLATGLLSATMPWLYYRAARELGLEQVPARLAWLLLAIAPSLLTVYSFFLHSTLLMALMGLGLWMSARHLRKLDRPSWLWSALVWTLAILTKRTALPVATICLAVGWWKGSRRPTDLVLAAAVMAALLIPNAIRSHSILGFPAPVGSGVISHTNFVSGARTIRIQWNGNENYHYASPSSFQYPLSPLSDWQIRTAREDSEVQVTAWAHHGWVDWQRALDAIPFAPERWLERWGENILLYLFAPAWPEAMGTSAIGELNRAFRWVWAPLTMIVLAGNAWWFARHRRLHLIPLATTVLALSLLFQNSYPMEGRYRKPVEPLLLLNAVWLCQPRPGARKTDIRARTGQQPAGAAT